MENEWSVAYALDKTPTSVAEAHASALSRFTMGWCNSLFWRGMHANQPIRHVDVWDRTRVPADADDFLRAWDALPPEGRTVTGAFRYLRTSFLVSCLLWCIYSASNFFNPLLLIWLLSYLGDPTQVAYPAWLFGAGMVLTFLVGSFTRYHSNLWTIDIGFRIRDALMVAVYRKSLKLSVSVVNTEGGGFVNLMSNDSQRLVDLMPWVAAGMVAPLEIIGTIVFVGTILGWYTVLILACVFAQLPLTRMLVRRMYGGRMRVLPLSDKRVDLTGELLTNIRIVKYYAWDQFFCDRLTDVRVREMESMSMVNSMKGLMYAVLQSTIPVSLLCIFLAYAGENGRAPNPSIVFPVMLLVNQLRMSLSILPLMLAALQNQRVAFGRLNAFLNLPEQNQQDTAAAAAPSAAIATSSSSSSLTAISAAALSANAPPSVAGYRRAPTVTLAKASFAWPAAAKGDSAPVVVLKDISVVIPAGKLTMIVGTVGAGKSSLISSILGQTLLQGGALHVDPAPEGGVGSAGGGGGAVHVNAALVPQSAWIINASVRDNITYGSEFDGTRYAEVIQACCLPPDLELFANGDQTEIGAKGVNLSGGQKQRVSIARCCYRGMALNIFDDPLSALDVHVGARVFSRVIKGMLADSTRIMVTNQLQYLAQADHIVMLQEGAVQAQGSYDELCAKGFDFGQMAVAHTPDADVAGAAPAKTSGHSAAAGKTVADEVAEDGQVGLAVYAWYARAGSVTLFLVCVLAMAVSCFAQGLEGLWMSYWSAQTIALSNATMMGLFACWCLVEALALCLSAAVFAIFGKRASLTAHARLLQAVSHSPIAFFDTVPVGRILNRFTRDMDQIDVNLWFQVMSTLSTFFKIIVVIVSIAIASYWLLLAIVPCAVVFYYLTLAYRRTSIQLQRLNALSLSPIFQHFQESLPGLESIRAYGTQALERAHNLRLVATNSRRFFALQVANTWLGLRLDWLGTSLVGVTIILMIVLKASVGPALAGFALSYAFTLTSLLNYGAKAFAQLEILMNGVERVAEFSALPSEPLWRAPNDPAADAWPVRGQIEFDRVRFRYRPGLPEVLHGVSFGIPAGKSTGIVGRTGAGKSSLLNILMRLNEVEDGHVTIDGVDIAAVGLHTLRRNIAIIPQEPVVFSGTVRSNVDPFRVASDADILELLERCQLRRVVEERGGLDADVSGGGAGFSVGQRQLLCLARALLKQPRVLLMDESSASLDLEADKTLQETVRAQMRGRTTITIAHRLQTILGADQIIVLEQGALAQQGSVQALAAERGSLFANLVEAAGIQEAELTCARSSATSLRKLYGDSKSDGDGGSSVTRVASLASVSVPSLADLASTSSVSQTSMVLFGSH